ncbi:hypothetical protein PP914_gp034 [Arthrobacter phage Qui]|jgi:hypothetical protein|uniref:Glycine-rich domain-containing protein n=1 Tax=Arthrobacter phage Qui TaxID=2603260 RepID=A0A5B8WFS9_9CAUD|nr:hypothetical protein PP914_gp034 [Arthrobacter phage Qui]QED11524.1 hypothetical protein SEA_QUI_34 [Arthrobacter phage Qui]QOC56356.1 hypothetical protein SEA_PAELLA_34 [Arthrobacter phage Paella]
MATITGLTSARMLEIENASVVNGYINELGHLILVTKAGTLIDAGPITTFLATEEAAGGVELATATETQAGTDTSRAVTPFGLATVLSTIQGYRPMGAGIIFTSSGTFTKANYPGLRAVRVRAVGGGGGGGGAPAATAGSHSAGGGGGGGGYAESFILESALSAVETVTVGAGGSGGVSGFGGTGGATSFGAHVSAQGGNGGNYFGDATLMVGAIGGGGGLATAGTIRTKGGSGQFGSGYATLAHGGVGGHSAMGGGGFGVYVPTTAGSTTGSTGGQYGGGGGGGAVNATGPAAPGGPGYQGIVIVEVFL